MPDRPHRKIKKRWIVLFIITSLFLIGITWFYLATLVNPPAIKDKSSESIVVESSGPDFFRCGNNWLKKSRSGLWEMYLEGSPFERGFVNGKMCKTLLEIQEAAFYDQIRVLVPSSFYLRFLKYFIYWFNRDLDHYMPEEYKKEIYGISLSASDKFSRIGSNYQRLLNYHSAHDIGHALQDLRLVGCTSFGVWDEKSKDSSLLIGRNFDFYAGDAFNVNKIVCFIKPDSGFPFMMVTWAGMVGTVSGMNTEGLTVTINAAKSGIPYSARMPISILAREILQYAGNIEEAYRIAQKRETFVSESILIGSAEDHRCALIEKSPYRMELFRPPGDYLVCTNHFQGSGFKTDPANVKDIRENASLYRYKKVVQDIGNEQPLDAAGMAKILRDRSGLNNENIGMGNEKAINQLIAHHSVIFEPEKRLVWVSASPWQLGEYVCYNISEIFNNFAGLRQKKEITDSAGTIAADPFLDTDGFLKFNKFKSMQKLLKQMINARETKKISGSFISEFIGTNPFYFEVYSTTGDYYRSLNDYKNAAEYYRLALGKIIPRQNEKDRIIEKLSDCIIRSKNR